MPHEEKRKLSKGFQNGISPSDPSTQTLVKEVQIFREMQLSTEYFMIKANPICLIKACLADQLQIFA